jgi:hypothetical protein
MSGLLTLVLFIILFYFILQLTSKFCFKPPIIEGLCADGTGVDNPSFTDQNTCEDQGLCDDVVSQTQTVCENGGGAWTPFTWTDDVVPAITGTCSDTQYVDEPNCVSHGGCNNDGGSSALLDATESTCVTTYSDQGSCSDTNILNDVDCTTAGGTWTPPVVPAIWSPNVWTPVTPADVVPVVTGTCSDGIHLDETTCLATGTCTNADNTSPLNATECTALWATIGSCEAGGVDGLTGLIPSATATTETDCANSDCTDTQGVTSSCEWSPETEGPRAVWTDNTWTPDIDCTGSWSVCTDVCETADQRTWIGTAAQSGSGVACPTAVDCQVGQDGCVTQGQELLVDTQQGDSQTLSTMNFNVILQPPQPSQPCQPGQTTCNLTTLGPVTSCLSIDDCYDGNTECINNICSIP